MKRIESRDNPLIRRLRAIAQGKPVRDETFAVLEGDHLVRAWLEAGHSSEYVIVDETAVDHPDITACLHHPQAQPAQLVAVPTSLMKTLSHLDSPPRLIAAIEPPRYTLDQLNGRDCVVLERVQDPGNVGAILRSAAAAGVHGVLVGEGCASLWSPKVLRAAMGAHAVLTMVTSTDLVADLNALSLNQVLATTLDAQHELYDLDLRQPCAWVFGHEGQGLSSTLMTTITQRLRIPQDPSVESLNVAAAAAVCLFEMRRQRRISTT